MAGGRGLSAFVRCSLAKRWLVLLLLACLLPSTAADGGNALKPEVAKGSPWEEDDGDAAVPVDISQQAYCPPPMWASAELLLWWIDGFHVPPLVTSGPWSDGRDTVGQLGAPHTDILLGDTSLDADAHTGARFRLGYWFDAEAKCGVEAVYFGLLERSASFQAASPTVPVITRPFYNREPGSEGPDTELLAFPGLFDGSIHVRGETSLQGVEVLYRQAFCQQCARRVDFLVGWRYNQLDDSLVISDFKRSLSANSGLQIGTTIEEEDRFTTCNQFQGAEIGVVALLQKCGWTLDVAAKLGLGNNHARVDIRGSTTVTVPDPDVAMTPTGLLAEPTNIGTYAKDVFALVPEVGISVGYEITPCLRATVGYTFLYWSQVARPGDQIDLDLNVSQLKPGGLTGAPRPAFDWKLTDMWAQGLSLGLDYRF